MSLVYLFSIQMTNVFLYMKSGELKKSSANMFYPHTIQVLLIQLHRANM